MVADTAPHRHIKTPRTAPVLNYGYTDDADPVEYDDRFHGPGHLPVADVVGDGPTAPVRDEAEHRPAPYADEHDGPLTDYAKTVHRHKGRPVVVPEWLPGVVRDRMAATNAKGQAYSAFANLVMLFAQVLYWSEPDKKGLPRSSGKNRRFSPNAHGNAIYEGHRGYWFVRFRPAVMRAKLCLSRGAVEVAWRKLVALQLVRMATPDATAKHKKIYVRVLYQNFVGDVAQWQEENLARLTEQDKRRTSAHRDKNGKKKPVPVGS
jgi:hypothetical protein